MPITIDESLDQITLSSYTSNTFFYVGTGGLLTPTTGAATNGQLLIGSTGSAPVSATLTAGSGTTITNGAGSITISNSGVTSNVAGTGISLSGGTGAVTITNTGVTSFSAGTTGFTPSSATTGAVTLSGTLNVVNGGTGLTSVTANNLLVGNGTSALNLLAPSGTNSKLRWTGSAYSWVADTLENINDVTITSVATNQVLAWNGSAWVNSTWATSPTSYSITVTSWTLVSGNLYYANVSHNLGTRNVSVTLYDTVNNTLIIPDSIVLTDVNTAKITVTGNTHSTNVTVIANGISVAPSTSMPSIANNDLLANISGITAVPTATTLTSLVDSAIGNTQGSILYRNSSAWVALTPGTVGQILQSGGAAGNPSWVSNASADFDSKIFSASTFENPNNSDWTINALAAATVDPSYNSMIVRSFSSGAESGVGFYATIPSGATNVVFSVKGRAATAPGSSATVILKLYSRHVPNNSAVGSWSSATTMTTITIPTNAFYQYNTATISLATLGLTAGDYYIFEITRSASDTLSGIFYMTEFTMGYT